MAARLGKVLRGSRSTTAWGEDARRTAANPHGCPCGGNHSRAAGEAKVAPIEAIVEASIEAKKAGDYQPALRTWVTKIRGPAYFIGTAKGAGFWPKLDARLRQLMREELDMQMRATAISPKDSSGGIHHGWMRGRIEDAIGRIMEADKQLRELKAYEDRQAARRLTRANRGR